MLNSETESLKASHLNQINEMSKRVEILTTELESKHKSMQMSEETAKTSKQVSFLNSLT